MLRIAPSGRFRRDVKRVIKRGKDIAKLTAAIDLLQAGRAPPARCNDHPLRGDWNGFRGCISSRIGC